jgi:hypothetical protein
VSEGTAAGARALYRLADQGRELNEEIPLVCRVRSATERLSHPPAAVRAGSVQVKRLAAKGDKSSEGTSPLISAATAAPVLAAHDMPMWPWPKA